VQSIEEGAQTKKVFKAGYDFDVKKEGRGRSLWFSEERYIWARHFL
jgi:hypothetical protein